MSDVYLDTAERDLQAAGLFCRRRDRGDRVVLTVKPTRRRQGRRGPPPRRVGGRAAPRAGAEAGPDEWPAGEAREQVSKAARGRPLQPLAEVRQTRVARALRATAAPSPSSRSTPSRSWSATASSRPSTRSRPSSRARAPRPSWRPSPRRCSATSRSRRSPCPSSNGRSPPSTRARRPAPCSRPTRSACSARIARRTDAAGRRARVLLALHDGALQRDAAARAGMAPRTVRYWLNRFRTRASRSSRRASSAR